MNKPDSFVHKWTNLTDYEYLASKFNEVSPGNPRPFCALNYQSQRSIWGKVARAVFGENLAGHRYWLQQIWHDNRKNIKVN